MTTHIGPPSIDKSGQHGVAVHLHLEAGGWHGSYRIATHGRSADWVAAEHARIVEWHSRKAAKLTELQSLVGMTIAGGFVIMDATVRDRGHGCELICRALFAGPPSVPLRMVEFFDDPSHVPSAQALVNAMNERIHLQAKSADARDQHVAGVRGILGLT